MTRPYRRMTREKRETAAAALRLGLDAETIARLTDLHPKTVRALTTAVARLRTTRRNVSGRDAEIARRYVDGEVMEAIAARFGISRQRVEQVLKRDGSPVPVCAVCGRRNLVRDPEMRRSGGCRRCSRDRERATLAQKPCAVCGMPVGQAGRKFCSRRCYLKKVAARYREDPAYRAMHNKLTRRYHRSHPRGPESEARAQALHDGRKNVFCGLRAQLAAAGGGCLRWRPLHEFKSTREQPRRLLDESLNALLVRLP